MRIEIESTTKIVEFNGVPARLWEGKTDAGIPVHCFITRIAVDKDDEAANAEFGRELAECKPPTPAVDAAYPARMVL